MSNINYLNEKEAEIRERIQNSIAKRSSLGVSSDILETISDFIKSLEPEKECEFYMPGFGIIDIDEIYPVGDQLIHIFATDTDKEPVEFVFHLSQLQLRLRAIPKKEEKAKRQKIGFFKD